MELRSNSGAATLEMAQQQLRKNIEENGFMFNLYYVRLLRCACSTVQHIVLGFER